MLGCAVEPVSRAIVCRHNKQNTTHQVNRICQLRYDADARFNQVQLFHRHVEVIGAGDSGPAELRCADPVRKINDSHELERPNRNFGKILKYTLIINLHLNINLAAT